VVALVIAASALSAALLFAVQPMAAKMVLPLLGGSASVWTLCMLFFQTGLLAGYGWAHVLGTRFRVRTQVLLHAAVAVAAILTLPPAIAGASLPPVDSSPAPWLLLSLAASFGLPYAVLAATGPLLQRWLASSTHAAARDPYFLYAASNAGSFAGLLAYPLALERLFPLRATTPGLTQAGLWSGGFVLLAALVVFSGVWTMLRPAPARDVAVPAGTAAVEAATRLRWTLLAFVPSSAMLGVTQYLTTDIAAIPLFWIVPLGLYLLTFVVAFSPRFRLPMPAAGVVLSLLLIAAAAEVREGPRLFGQWIFPLHLAVLVAVGLLCHAQLSQSRPDRSRLTEYYFFIALGGCCGGLFNGIVAPLVFDSIAEYPFALVLAAFLVPDPNRRGLAGKSRSIAVALDAATAVGVGAVAFAVGDLVPTSASGAKWIIWVTIGVPSLLAMAALGWPRRFAFAVAALLAVTWTASRTPWTSLHRERTFYGVHRVVETTSPGLTGTDAEGRPVMIAQKLHVLIDGVTRHGSQSLDRERRLLPSTYYHPTGPLGDIVRGLRARGPIADAGLIGLGAGTAAAYGDAGERFTYFEIDPAVARLAQDTAYFTYLADSRATVAIVLGDGRRRIAEVPDASYDLIVLDAFSSDAIPVHLLTREAVTLYLRKLKPRGCLAIHLTNGYLALDRVVAAIAAELHAPTAIKHDSRRTPREEYDGKDSSTWAVMVRDDEAALPVDESEGWVRVPENAPKTYLWTDDRSNLIGLLR